MHKIGDFIVYKRDVCKVIDYLENYYNNTDYYRLIPVNDNSLKVDIPVNNKYIRNILSKSEVNNIINNIPNIKTIEVTDKLIL